MPDKDHNTWQIRPGRYACKFCGEAGNDSEHACWNISPDGNGCTRPKGHDGAHIACGVLQHQHPLSMWTNNETERKPTMNLQQLKDTVKERIRIHRENMSISGKACDFASAATWSSRAHEARQILDMLDKIKEPAKEPLPPIDEILNKALTAQQQDQLAGCLQDKDKLRTGDLFRIVCHMDDNGKPKKDTSWIGHTCKVESVNSDGSVSFSWKNQYSDRFIRVPCYRLVPGKNCLIQKIDHILTPKEEVDIVLRHKYDVM